MSLATCAITPSPTTWPNVSLTFLNKSMSTMAKYQQRFVSACYRGNKKPLPVTISITFLSKVWRFKSPVKGSSRDLCKIHN